MWRVWLALLVYLALCFGAVIYFAIITIRGEALASNKALQKNLSKHMNRIEYAEQKRDAAWRDKWLGYYKKYRNIKDKIVDPVTGKPRLDRSNISIPYGFTMVETVLPRLVETIFAGRPYVTIKGIPADIQGKQPLELAEMMKDPEKPWEKAAKNIETLIDYQMNVPMDIQDLFAGGLKTMAIYGTTVAYTGWCIKERKVTRKEPQPVMSDEVDPNTGEPLPMLENDQPVLDWQPVTNTVKEYDDPEVQFLDLGLFYVDPNATEIDDARYCGHACYVSKAYLKSLEEQDVIQVDWKKLAKDGSRVNEARNYRQTSIGLPTISDQESNANEDDLYELIHHWEDDMRVLILNRCQVVAETENPYWHGKKPYDKDVYTEVPGEFYGIGVFEILEDLLDELNVERNQRIDYRTVSMRRMWKVRKLANIPSSELVWRQGGVINVEKMDDVQDIQGPDGALAGSFNQESIIKQDARDTIGAHEIVMGSGGGGTATEAMAKDNNASIRFKMIISSVEKRLLLGITRKMIQMDQQFIDDIRLLPLFDQDEGEWPIITPEEIQGEFHLIAAGSSVEPMANKEAFKQRMVELYGIAANDPFFQQFPEKRRNLLKMVFESFGISDTDDLLPSDQELEGIVQQQAVMEFLQTLPRELQQMIAMVMQGGAGQPAGQPQTGALPPGDQSMPTGGAANTAAMQEQGMQMAGAGV